MSYFPEVNSLTDNDMGVDIPLPSIVILLGSCKGSNSKEAIIINQKVISPIITLTTKI
jgi:hypothetical protein